MEILSGRANRRAFWLVWAIISVAQVAIGLAGASDVVADLLVLGPWVWIASRRLHDINASGWWSLAPMAIGFVEGFVRGFAEAWQKDHSEVGSAKATLTSLPANWGELVLANPDSFWLVNGFMQTVAAEFAASPITTTLGIAFTLILGLWPGTRGTNRFGEPPGRQAARPA